MSDLKYLWVRLVVGDAGVNISRYSFGAADEEALA
jgi:hypothetical protein